MVYALDNSDVSLHWNSNAELIWISWDGSGIEHRQQVTDTSYTGGTSWGDITRTKVFKNPVRQ